MDDQLIARYLATLAAEREAWEAVKGCLPGSSDYDAVKWQAWRQAVRASDEARRAAPCLSGFTGGPPAGPPTAAARSDWPPRTAPPADRASRGS